MIGFIEQRARVKVLDIPDNMLGVVTTKEGRPLAAGEIASPPVDGHNSFQDAQAFVDAGGGKGLQEQVMLAGRYFVNPRFATVEIKETTIVPIANVGVVIAYIGREGQDVYQRGPWPRGGIHLGLGSRWGDSRGRQQGTDLLILLPLRQFFVGVPDVANSMLRLTIYLFSRPHKRNLCLATSSLSRPTKLLSAGVVRRFS